MQHFGSMARYDALPNSSTAHDMEPSSQMNELAFNPNYNSTGSFSSSQGLAWRSGPTDKLLVLGASSLPLLASIYLLVATVTNRSSTGPLLSFIQKNRATTQIVVSLVSGRSLSLNSIAFIRAISTRSLAGNLPAASFITSITIVLLFALPNTLWTGALTPILTNATIVETDILKIPQYSTSSDKTWSKNGRLGQSGCKSVYNPKGIFSDCPVSILQSSLLSRAAQANLNLTQTHTKNDNSHYSYNGRSYGVGSAPGLVDENLYGGQSSSNLLFYNYTEPGYLAHVTCFYNSSSDWHLREIQAGDPKYGIPYIYYATGYFPNAPSAEETPDFFSVVGLGSSTNLAVIGVKRSEGRTVILITAGSAYAILNRTQCEVTLTPTSFTVAVDVVRKLITVLPPKSSTYVAGSHSPSFDATGGLADTVTLQANGLGMISTSLYTSIVGDSLMSNILAATTNSPSDDPLTALAAIADSFSVMLDDLLLFVGSSQFFIPNGTYGSSSKGDFSTVEAHLTVQAVRLGDAKYVFATFAMCVILIAAVAIEAYRTKIWKLLPRWDFMDTTSLVLASAVAGKDVVTKMCRGHGGGKIQWTGGGGLGDWVQEKGKIARDDWDCGRPEELSGFRLKLGKKVLRFDPAQQARNGDEGEDFKRGEEVQLITISLWASGVEGIVPLV
ncbi:MAG: hypothetical protein M1836_006867 [Candelina mexicana]|nr:MAG: hypothetical protein M1836_006867 [Candelina mexicana]